MPPRTKRPSAVNDKRNANGLAPPAKRIPKQKSDNNLHKHVAGKPTAADAPVDAPPTHDTSSLEARPEPNGTAEGSPIVSTMDCAPRQQAADGTMTPPEVSLNGSPVDAGAHADDAAFAAANGANGSARPPALAAADRSSTVIGYRALHDVVAVLLLLLQLPPTLLAFIQMFYAVMTFGNSTGGWSLSTLLSPHDWLHSHGGNPSILTSVTADIVVLCLWFAIPPAKDIILDFAQAVIAMNLGGGCAARGGATYTSICLFIIAVTHILRHTSWRQYGLDLLWSIMSRASFGPFSVPRHTPIVAPPRSIARGWPRTLLELHIVTQGVVRIIRRAVDHRSNANPPITPERTNSDSVLNTLQRPNTVDSPAVGGRNTSTDGRPPGPPPAAREARERNVSSGKKRRKQANFANSQQPLWAAIAKTKVYVTKEVDNIASRDAYEANAVDVHNLGAADSSPLDERFWISRLGETEVWFDASKTLLEAACVANPPGNRRSSTGSSDSGTASPLEALGITVCLNGANWSSVAGKEEAQDEAGGKRGEVTIRGKIFGLTPSTNYCIEFIRIADGRVLASATLSTRAIAEQENGSAISHIPPGTLRPSSPVTTLRNHIAVAESRLSEHRTRSKKTRKDHRSSTAGLKRDVENLEGRLSSCGGTDERQKQRQIQFKQNIRMAEESCVAIAAEIEELGEIPDTDRQMFDTAKKSWDEAQQQKKANRLDLDNSKAEGERSISGAHSEGAQVRQKREKLEQRINKLEQQKENLSSVNALNRKENIKRASERASNTAYMQNRERELRAVIQEYEAWRQGYEAQIAAIEQGNYFPDVNRPFLTGGPPAHLSHAQAPDVPGFSAGPLAGPRVQFSGNGFPAYQQHPIGTPSISSRRNSIHQQKPRGRSSSMLSNISGLTDDETAGGLAGVGGNLPIPPYMGLLQQQQQQQQQQNGASPPPKLNAIGSEKGKASPKH